MKIKDKLFWFDIRNTKTMINIHKKAISTFDYALFLNELTKMYIEAKTHDEVKELLKIQNIIIN